MQAVNFLYFGLQNQNIVKLSLIFCDRVFLSKITPIILVNFRALFAGKSINWQSIFGSNLNLNSVQRQQFNYAILVLATNVLINPQHINPNQASMKAYFFINSWYHENGSFTIHMFSHQYLSIVLEAGSWRSRFMKHPVSHFFLLLLPHFIEQA